MGTFKDFDAPVFRDLTSAIRALAMDAVQKANSGHPGMPMGMAEIAEVLEKVRPVFEQMSQKIIHVGGNGQAIAMKIYPLIQIMFI